LLLHIQLKVLVICNNFLNSGGYGADWTTASTLPALASGFGKTDFEGL
jgi:hypothetical protein